jgi:hypothetical protein
MFKDSPANNQHLKEGNTSVYTGQNKPKGEGKDKSMGRPLVLVAKRYNQFLDRYFRVVRDLVVTVEKAALLLKTCISRGRVNAGALVRLKSAKDEVELAAAVLLQLTTSPKGGPVLRKTAGADGRHVLRGSTKKSELISFSNRPQAAVYLFSKGQEWMIERLEELKATATNLEAAMEEADEVAKAAASKTAKGRAAKQRKRSKSPKNSGSRSRSRSLGPASDDENKDLSLGEEDLGEEDFGMDDFGEEDFGPKLASPKEKEKENENEDEDENEDEKEKEEENEDEDENEDEKEKEKEEEKGKEKEKENENENEEEKENKKEQESTEEENEDTYESEY